MSRTDIEWCRNEDGTKGWTVNPVKGLCPMCCSDGDGKEYCYARRMYHRFGWNPAIRYTPAAFDSVMRQGGPGQRIFVGSTMELFGSWVEPHVMPDILENVVGPFPQRTFIFLTKRPRELVQYSPWPDNCWVGASVTDDVMLTHTWRHLRDVKARVRFVSFEPLLSWGMPAEDTEWTLRDAGINWIIIGQKTPVGKDIPISWVMDIERAVGKVGIPVFEKDNMARLMSRPLRQEWPGR